MQKTMKRIGALILALAMLVTYMPVLGLAENAHADEEEESITVYMTVSDKGVIAKDNDGEAMAWREVEVTDLDNDGKYTFDEALKAAHEKYNSADGYVASSSGWVSKVWGDSTAGVYSFIQNSKATDLVTLTEVSEGDYLEAAVDQDAAYYSDYATYFDEYTKTVAAGEEFELTLKGFGAMTTDEGAPLAGIKTGALQDDAVSGDTVTDENGKAKFTFDEAGIYVITAEGVVKDAVSSVYTTPAGQTDDGKYYCSRMDYSTFDSYILYTEENYGDGPYPVDEVKEIDFEDWLDLEEEEQAEYHLVYASNYVSQYEAYYPVLLDAPIIVPCCVVKVLPEPVNVYMTVNNKGVLATTADGDAMAEKLVNVADVDEDTQLTVHDALIAAHEAYCPDGAAGYAAVEYPGYTGLSVNKLWGVDTYNTLFMVNGNGVYSVSTDTVKDDDFIYASLNKDDAYYSDLYTSFDKPFAYGVRGERIKLNLSASSTMGAELVNGLEGLQIGTWENGKFEPIEDALTDEDGNISLEFSEAGEYLITANGTVKATATDYSDWPDVKTVETDAPIMAPYCFVTIEEDEAKEAAAVVNNAIEDLPPADELTVDDKEAVEEVRAMYEALDDDAKEYVYDEYLAELRIDEVTISKLEVEAKLAEVQDELEEANQKIADKEELERILASMEETLKQAKAELMDGDNSFLNRALQKLIDATVDSIDAARSELEKVRAALNENLDRIDTLKEELKEAIESGLASEEEIAAKQAELDDAKKALAENAEKLAALEKQVSEAQADLTSIQAELKNVQETIAVQKKIVKKVKAKAQKKKAKVTWKSLGSGYKYEVYTSKKINGKFKKAKTVKTKKAVVKKLKSKKTYYVKVRGFKTVGGKTVYTQFSDTVQVKIK